MELLVFLRFFVYFERERPLVFEFHRRVRGSCEFRKSDGLVFFVEIEPEQELVPFLFGFGAIEVVCVVVRHDKFGIRAETCLVVAVDNRIGIFAVRTLLCDEFLVDVRRKFVGIVRVKRRNGRVFGYGRLTEDKLVRAVCRPVFERITRLYRHDVRAVLVFGTSDGRTRKHVFYHVVGKFEVVAVNVERDGILCLFVLIVTVVVVVGRRCGIARNQHRAQERGNEYDANCH